jgi:uncharacterized membrane protein
MEFLLFVLIVVLVVRWWMLRRRLATLERRLAMLELRGMARVEAPQPALVPAPPAAIEEQPVEVDEPRPTAIPPQAEDWETRIGGSWLNKAGVVVLVIGISLFLGYSLTNLGAAGRVAVGFAVSLAMLGLGIVLEHREAYVNFARGLIGGGWAAIYFTTYAMHALPAARLIESALGGMVLLSAVSIAMIAHSLRYRSEIVTGIAFFAGFITLAISPLSWFSVAASVPLAAALLFVARQFAWSNMALAGLIMTYSVYAMQGDPTPRGWLGMHPVLWIYWAMFEVFDLFGRPARALAPLNACGFLAVAAIRRADADLFLPSAAAAYIASAIARWRTQPPEIDQSLLRRLVRGYEITTIVAAGVTIAAIFERLTGLSVNVALLLQAEFIVLAAVRTRDPLLHYLAAGVFAFPLGKLLIFDMPGGATEINVAGVMLMRWTPVALLTAFLAYLNRLLTQRLPLYTWAGALVLTVVVGFEAGRDWVGVVWLLFAGAVQLAGSRGWLPEYKWQTYALLAAGTFDQAIVTAFERQYFIGATIAAAGLAHTVQILSPPGTALRAAWSVAGTALISVLLIDRVAGKVLTVALGLQGAASLVAGFVLRERTLRLAGLALFLFCVLKLFLFDLNSLDTFNRIVSFIVLGLLLLGASWIYTRFREQIRRYL